MVTRAIASLHGSGGLERHVDDLVRHLLERGVEVALITRPPRPVIPTDAPELRHERLTLSTVPYHTFPFAGRRGTTVLDRNTAYLWFGLRAGRRAARLVADRQVDLVHGHGASVLGAVFPTTTLPVPLVFTPHGLEEFGGTDPSRAGLKRIAYRPLQVAVRRCARSAARVVATDRSLVPSTVRHLRVPESVVEVLPNAVDLKRCDALAGLADGRRMRAMSGLPDGEAVLVSAGRIERNKGFDLLARALARVERCGTVDRWRWIIVGDGPYRSTLQRLIEQLELRDRTLLIGQVTDRELHAWYEAATLFVHPTLYEGSSLVTLEAMAHRRPVVGTRAGGLPDKVLPGVTGWLVPSGDPEALAKALIEALTLRERLGAMGEAGRELVERRFSWEAVTDRLLGVYTDVLAERASSRMASR
jgi:glycosyltransferase involved in cell wall biosynthesis|tara:strand:+ start:18710 stop:19960 length:1251 start_codon:yes stop_codon:yes gene_type:complete